MWRCELEMESTRHFFLGYHHFYHVERSELLNSLYEIDLAINEGNEDSIVNLVSFGLNEYHKQIDKYFLIVLLILKLL